MVARVATATGAMPEDTPAFMRELATVNAKDGWVKVWETYNGLTHSDEDQKLARAASMEKALGDWRQMREGAERARDGEGRTMASVHDLERQGASLRQIKSMAARWGPICAREKTEMGGIGRYYVPT